MKLQRFFIFTPIPGKIPILTSIFFKWVETTNEKHIVYGWSTGIPSREISRPYEIKGLWKPNLFCLVGPCSTRISGGYVRGRVGWVAMDSGHHACFGGGKGEETNDLFRGGSIHEITFDGFIFGNPPKFRNYPLVGVDLWDENNSTAPSVTIDFPGPVPMPPCLPWMEALPCI